MGHLLSTIGVEPERLSLDWASAAEAVRFVDLVKKFIGKIAELGPIERSKSLTVKMKAARPVLENAAVRMALARKVRTMRKEMPIPESLPGAEIVAGVEKAISTQLAAQELALHLAEEPLTAVECAKRLDRTVDEVVEIYDRLMKKKLVEPDRLIVSQ